MATYGTAEVRVEADTRAFHQDLQRQLRSARDVKVKAEPDSQGFARKLRSDLRSLVVAVRLRADRTQLDRELRGIRPPKIKFSADVADIRRAMDRVGSGSQGLIVRVRADVTAARQAIEALRTSLPELNIPVRADTSAASQSLAALRQNAPPVTVPVVLGEPSGAGGGGINGLLAGIVTRAQGAGLAIAAGLGAGAAGFQQIISVSADFEAEMNTVKALSGAAGKEFEALRDTAKQLGSTTQFSASQAAGGMQELAKAGLSATDTIAAVPSVLNLATASGMSMADIANIMTNAMAAFQIEADDAGKVTDEWAAIVTGANADIKGLADGLANVGATASLSGLSLADTSRALATMTDAGIPAADSGTALRNVLDALAKGGGDLTKAMKSAGVSLKDQAGKTRPLIDVIRDLATSEISAADAQKVFGIEGKKALDVIGLNIDKFDDLGRRVDKSSGSVKEMADVMGEGGKGGIKGFQSAMEGLLIALGDTGILDVFTTAMGKLTSGVGSMTKAVEGTDLSGVFSGMDSSGISSALSGIKSVVSGLLPALRPIGVVAVAAFAAFLQALKPLGAALKSVGGFLKENSTSVEVFGSVMVGAAAGLLIYKSAIGAIAVATRTWAIAQAALTLAMNASPVGLIITGVSALVVAVVYAWNRFEGFRDFMTSLWDGIKSAWTATVDWVKDIPENLAAVFTGLPAAIGAGLTALGGIILDAFGSAVDFLTGTLPGLLLSVVEVFASLPGMIFEGLGMLAGLLVLALVTAFQYLWEQIPIWIQNTVSFFQRLPGMIVAALFALGSMIGKAFQAAINFLVSTLPAAIGRVLTFFRNFPGQAVAALGALGARIGGVFSSALTATGGRVRSGLNSIVGFFRSLPGQIRSALSAIGTGVWNGLKSTLNAGIRLVNRAVHGFNKFSPKNVPTIPELADGAVVHSRTLTYVGEAGPEAVIPLMRPRRAAQLAEQSGLIDLLQKQGLVVRTGSTDRSQSHTWNITSNASDPRGLSQALYNRMTLATGV